MSQKLMLEWKIFKKAVLLSLRLVTVPVEVHAEWYYKGWEDAVIWPFTRAQWFRVIRASKLIDLILVAILLGLLVPKFLPLIIELLVG